MRNALAKAGDGRAAAAREARLSSAPARSPGQDAATGPQPNLAPQPAPTQTPSARCHGGFTAARVREAGASPWGAAPHHQLEAIGRSWGDSDPNGTGRWCAHVAAAAVRMQVCVRGRRVAEPHAALCALLGSGGPWPGTTRLGLALGPRGLLAPGEDAQRCSPRWRSWARPQHAPRSSAVTFPVFPLREKFSSVRSKVMQTGDICVSSAVVCRYQRFVMFC